jgi:hypothetical protein
MLSTSDVPEAQPVQLPTVPEEEKVPAGHRTQLVAELLSLSIRPAAQRYNEQEPLEPAAV